MNNEMKKQLLQKSKTRCVSFHWPFCTIILSKLSKEDSPPPLLSGREKKKHSVRTGQGPGRIFSIFLPPFPDRFAGYYILLPCKINPERFPFSEISQKSFLQAFQKRGFFLPPGKKIVKKERKNRVQKSGGERREEARSDVLTLSPGNISVSPSFGFTPCFKGKIIRASLFI